jgi:hypothetical protein
MWYGQYILILQYCLSYHVRIHIYASSGFYTVRRVDSSSVADPDHFDTDPDPGFHFDTDPDPILSFILIRIRIRLFDTDPDPDP